RYKHFTRSQFLKRDVNKHLGSDTIFNIQSVDCFESIKPYLNKRDMSFVLTVHGAYADQLKARGYNKHIINKVKDLEKEAYCSVPGLVTVSNHMAKYLTDISGRSDIHVIPNGVEILKLENKKTRGNKEIKCILAGSLIYYKGGHIAIDAISLAI